MTSETQAGSVVDSYSYDGDGRRIKRNTNGNETWQVYGLGGELLAEYAANATLRLRKQSTAIATDSCLLPLTRAVGPHWLVDDQLGTPRMVFDHTGGLAATKRHDYLPFGEELVATQGFAQRLSGTPGIRLGRNSPGTNTMARRAWTLHRRVRMRHSSVGLRARIRS